MGVLEDSSVSSLESLEAPEAVEEDVWTCLQNIRDDRVSTNFKSWETFYDKPFQEPKTAFLSEAGPHVFDAAVVKSAEDETSATVAFTSGHVIQSEALLSSLVQLALARESILYHYVEEERSFRPRKENVRMSGYSLETFGSLTVSFINHGNRLRTLQDFINETQQTSRPSAALVALAGAFLPILSSLEAQIGSPPTRVRSLLQLQSLVERPSQVLSCLTDVVTKICGARTDEELLSILYELVQNVEHSSAWLSSTLHGLLVAASRPWLESMGGWLGLQQSDTSGFRPNFPNFIVSGEEGHEYEPLSMPSFIPKEDGSVIFETGQSLRLLEAHQPDHPLTKPSVRPSDTAARLEWQFSWDDVEKISTKAKNYESSLRKAIKEFSLDGPIKGEKDAVGTGLQQKELVVSHQPNQSAKAFIDASITAFEKPFPDLEASPQAELGMNDVDGQDAFVPPLSLLSTLSFNPIISAQARLIARACLRLLFKGHHLRSHFSLLHRYTLMSDGVFTSRLSHALFDPDLHSAERQRGHSRSGTSGLKLGHRDTWPPASSELRLALMGILTDSYFGANHDGSSSMFREELPGGLSFAIREMSEDELKRCMDPNSIEALDFLRLQYKPPAPLDTVIIQTSLTKYDTVFKLLLRCIRMLFVVNQLSQASASRRGEWPSHASFRIKTHHFVSTVCSYFFDGVTAHWHILERKLQQMERAADDFDGSGGESIYNLRDFHDQLLDRMMLALLLRKRQVKVMALLEEIFSMVLQFAWLVGSVGMDEVEQSKRDAEVREIHEKFTRKTRVFVDVCRGLSEQRGLGGTKVHDDGAGEEGENTIGQLLLRFEMGGFYTPR